MSTSLRSLVQANLGWTWRDEVGDSAVVDSSRLAYQRDLPDGGEAGQADAVWHAHNRVLAEGEGVELALDALEQPLFGNTIITSMQRVKAVLIVNRNTGGPAYLLVGGSGIDEWSEPFGMVGDTANVMPGSPLLLANLLDGWPVEPSASVLRIEANDGPVTFDIAILGTLAGAASPSSSSPESSSGA